LLQQVSTQAPLHGTWPGPQSTTHWPDAQNMAGGQAASQAPQWAGSDPVSTQKPEQLLVPGGQTHAPPEQNEPPVHATPQAPQFAELVERSTQEPPHGVFPGPHWVTHAPELHRMPEAHAVSQPPQCSGSVERSTQAPSQLPRPAGHAQLPMTQLAPPVHASLQAPQWNELD
jgi:hypothetical protein